MTLALSLPFGIRDVKLIPYPTLAATAFGTTMLDVAAARTFTYTDAEEFVNLEGDDNPNFASHGKGATGSGTIEAGGVSIDVYAALAGGMIIETGVTPNQVKRYRKGVNDARPYWAAIGQSISDNGGDMHGILYRCKATGDLGPGENKYGEFAIPSTEFTMYPCLVDGDIDGEPILDALYDIAQHETITAIVAPALD